MLVNSTITINGKEVLEVDSYTATLPDGTYIWGYGEYQSFIDQLDIWADMPLADDMMIPTHIHGKFVFMDSRKA